VAIHYQLQNVAGNPLNNRRKISAWINKCILDHYKNLGDINVVLMSDEDLLKINVMFLKHNFYTDIITFPMSNDNTISGDLCISYDRVIDNAKELNIAKDIELLRVIIHGVLHLCGYDDHSINDKEQMTQKEDYYLSIF